MAQQYVGRGICNQDNRVRDDECPGSAETGDGIGDTLTEGFFLLNNLVRVAGGEHGEHVHAGVGLAFEEDEDVVTVHFNTNGFFLGGGGGLVWSWLEHGGETEELS